MDFNYSKYKIEIILTVIYLLIGLIVVYVVNY